MDPRYVVPIEMHALAGPVPEAVVLPRAASSHVIPRIAPEVYRVFDVCSHQVEVFQSAAFFLVLQSEEVVRGGVPDIVHVFQEGEIAVVDLGEGEAFVFPFGVGTQGIVLGEDPIESEGRGGKG